jgi:AGZA family xanthine/uracil permease-like MFS transporter
MGGRAGYTIATALFVGILGYFGGFTLLFEWLPRAAMFPILVFVGLEITAQSFQATPPRHYPALALAMLPALAYLVVISMKGVLGQQLPEPNVGIPLAQTLRCLSNGFLISSLLWAAALAMLVDGKPGQAACFFALAGLGSFFGLIHSPLPDEQIGWPWQVLSEVPTPFQEAVRYQTPYHWAASYAIIVLLLIALAIRPSEKGH